MLNFVTSSSVEGEFLTGQSTEPQSEPEGDEVFRFTFISLYGLCIILIVLGNGLIALSISRDSTLRKQISNLFLLSLLTARASLGLLVVPARITGMFSEKYLGSILCKLCHFMSGSSSVASVLSISSIAIVKYNTIVLEKRSHMMSMKKSLGMIIIIWLFAAIYSIKIPITFDLIKTINDNDEANYACTFDPNFRKFNRSFVILDFIILFVIPLLIILVCYSRVLKKLSEKKAENNDQDINKSMKMLITLITLFIICNLPVQITRLYVSFCGYVPSGFNIIENTIHLISYSNSWFNIAVFLTFRKELRQSLKNFFKRNKSNVIHVESIQEKSLKRDNNVMLLDF